MEERRVKQTKTASNPTTTSSFTRELTLPSCPSPPDKNVSATTFNHGEQHKQNDSLHNQEAVQCVLTNQAL